MRGLGLLILTLLVMTGCTFGFEPPTPGAMTPVPDVPEVEGESARVTRVIDGDTIDVEISGVTYRLRYIGANTPELDEPCYADARAANERLVRNQTVTLVRDRSETDRFGRLLRYVYVNGTFVNARLIEEGWAEVVLYPPDNAHYDELRALERQAAAQNLGCHPTGIFNDGSDTR